MGFFTINAQEVTFSYNFDDGTLTGWRTFTGEGHVGNGWEISPNAIMATYQSIYQGTDESDCLVSMYYDVFGGSSYKPNAYVVTEAAYQMVSNSVLSWNVKAPYSSGEYYEVVVSEDNETFEAIYEETIANKDVMEARTLNIAEVAADKVGKTLYIGFRHYGATSNSNAAHVCIDDVVLTGEAETIEPTAPAAPQNLTATVVESTITLTWDVVEGATYNVYSAEEVAVAEGLTEAAYTATELAAGEYCFTVTAVKDELESEKSEEECATVEAADEGGDEGGDEGDENEGDEDVAYLIREYFDGFTAGDKIAEKGSAWWTTWDKKPGTATDGVIAEIDGNLCAHITPGNDQVLLLGGQQAGVYDLEFDILVPDGKSGYFNILHEFKGGNSTWAMQAYLHMTDNGQTDSQAAAPGHGTVHAGGNSVADVACIYDAWMHFRLHIDTDADTASYYYTTPGNEEVFVCGWQWSKDSFGHSTVGRKLDAMNFYPPLETSEYYLDNFTLKKIGGDSAADLDFDTEELEARLPKDDVTSVELSFENTGTSIAEYVAWVDYGMGEGGNDFNYINYDRELGEESVVTGFMDDEPVIFEIGAMFPAESYGNAVAGTYITSVAYLFTYSQHNTIGIEEGEDVVFRIYGQGLYGQPGKVLAEKVVTYEEVVQAVEDMDWTFADFDEPVALTGYNVWATVTFTHAVGTNEKMELPFVFDGNVEAIAPYGDLFRVDNSGQFYKMSESVEARGNFHLRVVCQGKPVTGGWAELDKAEGVMPIGAEETITVDLSSIGLKGGETYEANLVLSTNVPEKEMIEIPISMYVFGEDVEEILSDTYNIYPNPTIGMVTVEAENINYIAVYNSVGQLVNVVNNSNNVVDMSNYDNGVYYFNIVDNAGVSSVQRVVVAK